VGGERAPIAFLDRDGVINVDHGYIGSPDNLDLIVGVPQALKMLQDEGYKLTVVTNQSGIARGYYTEADYRRVTAHLVDLLSAHGVRLDLVLHCPHGPRDNCRCRKPKPGMILDGLRQLHGDARASILFGDKVSDIAAGRAAGIARSFLIGTSVDTPVLAESAGAAGHCADLLACAHLLSTTRSIDRWRSGG
jgi:D-glycero-D-manno-heptose 1,7-bisphosphate phosphatase